MWGKIWHTKAQNLIKKKVKIAWKFLVWPCTETKIPRSAHKGYPRVYGIKQPGVLFLPLNGPLTPLVSQTVHSFLPITLYSWVKHHDSEVLCSWTHHNNPSHHFNWKPLIFYPLCWQGFIRVLTEENQKIMKTSKVADLQSFTANKVDVVNLYNVIKSYAPYLLQPLLLLHPLGLQSCSVQQNRLVVHHLFEVRSKSYNSSLVDQEQFVWGLEHCLVRKTAKKIRYSKWLGPPLLTFLVTYCYTRLSCWSLNVKYM